jgi:hypothetical protein
MRSSVGDVVGYESNERVTMIRIIKNLPRLMSDPF